MPDEWRWIRGDKEGVLVLDGTPFRIEYDGSSDTPFCLIGPRGIIARYLTLAMSKLDAEGKAAEFKELGLL